jgi:hypothetical protein
MDLVLWLKIPIETLMTWLGTSLITWRNCRAFFKFLLQLRCIHCHVCLRVSVKTSKPILLNAFSTLCHFCRWMDGWMTQVKGCEKRKFRMIHHLRKQGSFECYIFDQNFWVGIRFKIGPSKDMFQSRFLSAWVTRFQRIIFPTCRFSFYDYFKVLCTPKHLKRLMVQIFH